MKHFTTLLIITIFLQVTNIFAKKSGNCPQPGIGICVGNCKNDESCKGVEKCVRINLVVNKIFLV